MGLLYCLYTRVMTSLDSPNVVLVSVQRTLRHVFAFVLMLSAFGLNVIPLSCVSPSVVTVLA